MSRWKKRLKKWRFKFRKQIFKLVPDVMHIGRRALVRGILLSGKPGLEKRFALGEEGRLAMERELLAQKMFGKCSWLVPAVERGGKAITMPRYKEEQRLDLAAPTMTPAERLDAARQAVRIAWEIFEQGYAHRDFHSRNFFWVNGRLMATDFEAMEPYPKNQIPAFPESYDLVGKGLPTAFSTRFMSYTRDNPVALEQTLGIPLSEAIKGVHELLSDRLREESLSFQTVGDRHITKAERIYGSFTLPHFSVSPDKVQRNSARRMDRFGIDNAKLNGRHVLDLGCHCGAMLLEAQRFGPATSLGIEFDPEKVEIARGIARYNGLNNVEFRQGDVDALEPEDLGRKVDVVFCFAINKHVKNPAHLYDLLGRITGEWLFFEGNAGTDLDEAIGLLRKAGFASVTSVGMSDDDCIPKNNNRPMIVARKQST